MFWRLFWQFWIKLSILESLFRHFTSYKLQLKSTSNFLALCGTSSTTSFFWVHLDFDPSCLWYGFSNESESKICTQCCWSPYPKLFWVLLRHILYGLKKNLTGLELDQGQLWRWCHHRLPQQVATPRPRCKIAPNRLSRLTSSPALLYPFPSWDHRPPPAPSWRAGVPTSSPSTSPRLTLV